MSTKKTANKLDVIIEKCPFSTLSKFEMENFNVQTGPAFARSTIEIINRIRKIDSELKTTVGEFEKNCKNEEKEKLTQYLQNLDPIQLENTVTEWEATEREYWVNTLGKQAAIEILTVGRPSLETMSKMVRLPEDLYIKATQICVRLANAIKETTAFAEEEVGVAAEQAGKPTPLSKIVKKNK